MKLKLTFLAGAAVGYVLGARAGRDRYEPLKHQAETLWHDPRVQEKVTVATDKAKNATSSSGDGDLIGEEKGRDYEPKETKVQSS